MYPRPKADETEEDLLRLQREYFENKTSKKIQPAAKLVANEPNPSETSPEQTETDLQKHLANTFEAIPSNMCIGEVMEKRVDPEGGFKTQQLPTRSGFPQAKRRDVKAEGGKGSIFSQQIKRMKKAAENESGTGEAMSIDSSQESVAEKVNLPTRSYILDHTDRDDIHKANVKMLSKMSEKEILEERERLIATLDPALVAFVRSRREKCQTASEHKLPSADDKNKIAEDIKIKDIATVDDILTKPEVEKWLNFDVIETNKLCWMKEANIPKIEKNQLYEARFDFTGLLLPFSLPEIDEKNRILYHHGEEPGRPGYTLQELFQLARSSVIQQKIIALNTLANIMNLNSTGVYDNIIDLPVEQMFFVIRFCLDENNPAVLNAAIKAMRNLFCSSVDEVCLDSLLGFGLGMTQPMLSVDDSNEDDYTVNDQQLAEINLVKCLARSEILTRIRYIINTIQPTAETVIYCLDILIRLARDCDFILKKMYSQDDLIKSIIKYFVPSSPAKCEQNSAYGSPLLQAIKLLRIISARSEIFAIDLVKKFKIADSITFITSNQTFANNSNGLRLQAECFNFWSVLVNYGLLVDHFNSFSPIILSLLDFHVRQTNISASYVRQSHAASILNFISQIGKRNRELIDYDLKKALQMLLEKLSWQFSSLKEFTCGKLQIISSLLMCLSVFEDCNQWDLVLISLINSAGFTALTNNMRYSSNFLNNFEMHQTSANMKTLEAASWNTSEHVVPILQSHSSLPFLRTLSEIILKANQKVKVTFLRHENIKDYISLLRKEETFFLSLNWFSRIESEFIMYILKISIDVQADIDTAIYYELAVKSLCVFNAEQKNDVAVILKEIILNTKFYPSEVLLKNLSIDDKTDILLSSLNNLNEILEVYIKVLNLQPISLTVAFKSLCVDIKLGNLIPADWVYSPIMILHSNREQKRQMPEIEQTYLVEKCLRWILIYETYFPDLAALINPTDRFCRLACVFLASDNLFLNQNVQDLLQLCFKNLMSRSGNEINFNSTIQGLNNFQDFYTQLLEQYQGVSYGNVLFGNFILVPLAQKHSIKWRKTLWSEYAGVLQIFNVTPEQCVYEMQLFLEPAETEMSLLKCYRRALVSEYLRKNTVLYIIAKHHVECFVGRKKQAEMQT